MPVSFSFDAAQVFWQGIPSHAGGGALPQWGGDERKVMTMEMDEHQTQLLRSIMQHSKEPSAALQALTDPDHRSMQTHAKAAVDEAKNPETSRARLGELAASPNTPIRQAVAARLDCPLGLMIELSADDATEVRMALAANPSAAPVMEQLAQDRNRDVVKTLAVNPALPQGALLGLTSHKRRDVRNVALERLRELERTSQTRAAAAPELQDRAWPPTQAPPSGPQSNPPSGAW